MRNSRLKTLLIGLAAGVVYAFLSMLVVYHFHQDVSITYIFVLPVILGALPVLFSTKEQLEAYKTYLIMPWLVTFTFFVLSFVTGFEGMICLVIIVGPFLILGSLGAFIFRLIKLKSSGKGTKLYFSLFLPVVVLVFETGLQPSDKTYTVSTDITVNAGQVDVWRHVKNVKDIQAREIRTHFVHLIGVPKPISAELDKEAVGGVRSITWEKGIKFSEKITQWNEGDGFSYDIDVDPSSIPPKTLDEHVMIGGRYFDVLHGSYLLRTVSPGQTRITLRCTYRVSTNLNLYSRVWANFILNDFHEMILEVIKARCENK